MPNVLMSYHEYKMKKGRVFFKVNISITYKVLNYYSKLNNIMVNSTYVILIVTNPKVVYKNVTKVLY